VTGITKMAGKTPKALSFEAAVAESELAKGGKG
jgi:hypothetical protein